MRKEIALLALTLLIVSTATAQASNPDSRVNPGIAPGNPFYGVEKFVESLEVRIAGMIGGPDLKSKALANNAQERLAEARMLSDINRSDEAEQALQEYSSNINRSRDLARGNNNSELGDQIDEISRRNTEALNEIKKKVPEEAKKGIETALQNSNQSRPGLEQGLNRGSGRPETNLSIPEEASRPLNEDRKSLDRPSIVNKTADNGSTENPSGAIENQTDVVREGVRGAGNLEDEGEQNRSEEVSSSEDQSNLPEPDSSSPESSDENPSDRLTGSLP